MGADILVAGKMAIVNGGKTLSGTSVRCPDLRAGAALVIAAMAAEGETEVTNLRCIDRGYDEFDDKLRALGAKIRRVESETPDL
jgi:UDP-N-acetylglucosamine 1-carboxyvinyltransferase